MEHDGFSDAPSAGYRLLRCGCGGGGAGLPVRTRWGGLVDRWTLRSLAAALDMALTPLLAPLPSKKKQSQQEILKSLLAGGPDALAGMLSGMMGPSRRMIPGMVRRTAIFISRRMR